MPRQDKLETTMKYIILMALCALFAPFLAGAWQAIGSRKFKSLRREVCEVPARLREQFAAPCFANIAEGTHDCSVTKFADEAITSRHLLYKVGSDADHVTLSDASSIPLGTVADEVATADIAAIPIAVLLLGKSPTKRMVASEAMATTGVDVFAAASGKIALSGSIKVGTLLTTASADGDVVEVADCEPAAALSALPLAGGVGYRTGAGGTVTQATNKATGVTLNKRCGAITMSNANLASLTAVSFVLTNTGIAAGDVLVLNHISGGTPGSYLLNARSAAGSATIDVTNITGGTLGEAIVIQYAVVKAVSA